MVIVLLTVSTFSVLVYYDTPRKTLFYFIKTLYTSVTLNNDISIHLETTEECEISFNIFNYLMLCQSNLCWISLFRESNLLSYLVQALIGEEEFHVGIKTGKVLW